MEHGGKKEGKKGEFSLFGNKVNHSEIRILILISNNYEKFGRVGSYEYGTDLPLSADSFAVRKGGKAHHTHCRSCSWKGPTTHTNTQ